LICGHDSNKEILIHNNESDHIESKVIIIQQPYQLVVENSSKYQLLNENSSLNLNIAFLNKLGFVFQGEIE